jgi:hypothetical protein
MTQEPFILLYRAYVCRNRLPTECRPSGHHLYGFHAPKLLWRHVRCCYFLPGGNLGQNDHTRVNEPLRNGGVLAGLHPGKNDGTRTCGHAKVRRGNDAVLEKYKLPVSA